MEQLHLDFETYNELNLETVGVHRYVEHPSFKPLCVAWQVGNSPVQSARLLRSPFPNELNYYLARQAVQGHAWNAAFERCVLGQLHIEPAHALSCTMQRALAYGLPASLKKAAPALGLITGKDMAGHRLMMRLTRPPWQEPTEEEWAALLRYCERDVAVEHEISSKIPELSEEEAELAQLDAVMNDQGIHVDIARVQQLEVIALEAEKAEAAECARLTAGAVTSPGTQSKRLVAWLQGQGCEVGSASRTTVEDQLMKGLPSDRVRQVLGIRLRTARASTKKLRAMRERVSSGSRLRGQFQFLGAARTGRWAGRGIQPQNLPRGRKDFSPLLFSQLASRSNGSSDALAALDAVAPFPLLDCVSWSLRSVLGKAPLWSFDFSQIEARVLAWLAGQADVLEVFRRGEDVYVWAAQQFGSDNRQLGKVLILALGFGMGPRKLRETARKDYGVILSVDEATAFHRMWKFRNKHIVDFWDNIEAAAHKAIIRRNEWIQVEKSPVDIALKCTARTLQMRLPSGRMLYYHKPAIELGGNITYWGEEKGMWVQRRTWGGTLAENATQAVARDIMSTAMLRIWSRLRLAPTMCVHDEVVYSDCNQAKEKQLASLVSEPPSWAGGLPIKGEAKLMQCYGVPAQ